MTAAFHSQSCPLSLRTETTYTLTPDKIQGAVRLSMTARAQHWIITPLDLFTPLAARYVVHREETGTWIWDGGILTLEGNGAPGIRHTTWVLKKR